MLTPFEPSAGPTGGAGVAFPFYRASFINPTTASINKHKHITAPNFSRNFTYFISAGKGDQKTQ